MENSKDFYSTYTKILKSELLTALGCTEPICIAYCSAVMRDALIEDGWIQPIDPDTEANPMEVEDTDGMMELIDRLAIDTHKRDDSSSCLNL